MIKYQFKIYNLFILLIVGLFMATNACGQSGISKSIIKSISLQPNNNEYFLVIEGLIFPDTLSGMKMKTKGKKHVLTIPNAARDIESIPSNFRAFEAGEPLENFTIAEQPLTEGDDYSVQVKLFIQGRNNISWSDPVKTDSMITYKLISDQQTQPEQPAQPAQSVQQTQPAQAAQPVQQTQSATNTQVQIQQSIGTVTPSSTSTRMETQEIIRRFKKPSVMQVSILNASGFAKRAYKLSVYLGKIKKKIIEESLGLKLDIVNIANSRSDKYPQSTIYFRENFLKSALFLAELIPSKQKVVPLKKKKKKIGVDIEIFLGKDYK